MSWKGRASEIATAFPGLFSYKDLLNLDLRDFQSWYLQARYKNAEKRLVDFCMMQNAYACSQSGNKQYANQKFWQLDFEIKKAKELIDNR
jgi:hypothetical protein